MRTIDSSFPERDSVCIVVPCYNEETSLPFFWQSISLVEDEWRKWGGRSWYYVFVDDGSSDGTLRFLRQLNQADPNRHYVSFSRNFGKEAALLAGLNKALEFGVDYVAVMDCDLQDPPELLLEMCERIGASDCDVVAAYRESRDGEPPIRSWFAHRFYSIMNGLSGLELKDGARDFRLMRRKVAETIVSLPERARFSKGIFSWVGFKTEWVGYANVERAHGNTHWSFWQLVRYAVDGLIDFSSLPLEAISIAGLIAFLLSLAFLLFIIVRAALFGDPVAGWPSLVSLITLFSSLQLFSMGMLGIYISKIYIEVKDRPSYVITEEA